MSPVPEAAVAPLVAGVLNRVHVGTTEEDYNEHKHNTQGLYLSLKLAFSAVQQYGAYTGKFTDA